MWGPKEPKHDVGTVTLDADNGAQCAAPPKTPKVWCKSGCDKCKYNRACGISYSCDCHNIPTPTEIKEEFWEDNFKAKFCSTENDKIFFVDIVQPKEIIDFIHKVLEKALDDQGMINASIKDTMVKHYYKKIEEAEKSGRRLGADMAIKILMSPIHECSICKTKFKKVDKYTYEPDCEHFSKDIVFGVLGKKET